MRAESFVDTNILLYFLSKEASEKDKSRRATEILMRDDCGLSFQVLSECYVNATSKSTIRLPHEQVMAFLETLDRFPIVSSSMEHFRLAADIAHQRQLKFWDAAIVASAQMLGCTTLYSEDFQHGQRFGSVRVVNPFRT
jgi:predicted nucleic acid-binding protein